MVWRNKVTNVTGKPPSFLEAGNLVIVGNSDRNESLNTNDLTGILAAVKDGYTEGDRTYPITKLTLCQIKLSEIRNRDVAFIQELLSIPTLTSIDFVSFSSFAPNLTREQTAALMTGLTNNKTVKELVFQCIDNQESANAISNMLRSNKTLTTLGIHNLTDDAYGYGVLRVACGDNTALRVLNLPMTSIGFPDNFPIRKNEVKNTNLSITFEGRKSFNTSTFVDRPLQTIAGRRSRTGTEVETEETSEGDAREDESRSRQRRKLN